MIELITQKLLDGAYAIACDVLADRVSAVLQPVPTGERPKPVNRSGTAVVRSTEVRSSIDIHLETTKRWCSSISFVDLPGSKHLEQIHIQLESFLTPQRLHLDYAERAIKRPLTDILRGANEHVVVLGSPGAGKTTSMKKLCSDFFNGRQPILNQTFPILLRLRDPDLVEANSPIFDSLRSILPLELHLDPSFEASRNQDQLARLDRDVFIDYLDALRPTIILDGFDEVPSQTARARILAEFRTLCRRCKGARLILTCRTGEFRYNIEGARTFEIAPLDDLQIREFSYRWIRDSNEASKFYIKVSQSTFADTAMKPLLLAHLCAIYERIGTIPAKPKTVYRKIVSLVLEDWDQQQSIRRLSTYSQLEIDRKIEFLGHLAFSLTTVGLPTIFSKHNLQEAYLKVCKLFSLPPEDAAAVADELESHTGLLVQSGFERYEFAHKSIQEYLVGEYIVRLPSLRRLTKFIPQLGAELAIAVAIASNPAQYLSELVIVSFTKTQASTEFISKFLTRLSQENPDFIPAPESTLALLLLSHLGAPDLYLTHFVSSLVNDVGFAFVLDHYKVGEEQQSRIDLRITKGLDDLQLPPQFSVSARVMRSVRECASTPIRSDTRRT